ncbi:MAG TPA: zinc ribbon domain-containing protein [Thermoplasmata archaeon]|nr:zinc ribbon domain-containing protein [Thermoplasmata archaeon]
MDPSLECPHCGTTNSVDATSCRMCGKHLKHTYRVVDGVPVCTSCGASNPEGADLCNSCHTPLRELIENNLPANLPAEECVHWSEGPSSPGRAAMVMVAGILILMAGVLGVAQSVLSLSPDLGEGFLDAYEDIVPGASTTGDLLNQYALLQVGVFVFGVIAIFGSMFALNRSRFDMSVVGAVSGILAIGLLFGAFLSLVALIVLLTSRKNFDPECA